MVSNARAWREADRVDRLRYSQPERLRGEQSDSSSVAKGPASSSAPTLYSLLGVDCTASQLEIRRAYHRLLVSAHPDKGGDPDRFQQLKAAFTQLSDPTERLIYDEKLERSGSISSSSRTDGAKPTDPARQATCHRAGGVMAVVHGQTQGLRQQQPRPAQAAPPCSGNVELQQATAEILQLQAAAAGSSAAKNGTQLAAAHLRRAVLYQAACQLHHALFDAEEALQLQPDHPQAAALVESLLHGLEDGQAQQQAAADPEDEEQEDDLL